MSSDKQEYSRLGYLISAVTVGTVTALGIGGVVLYVRGKAAVTAGKAEYIFSKSDVTAFLKPFLIPLAVLVILLILAAIWKIQSKEPAPYIEPSTRKHLRNGESICAHKALSGRRYFAVYLLAIFLIAAGAVNGGVKDVLVKAINICTECIGLG